MKPTRREWLLYRACDVLSITSIAAMIWVLIDITR